MDALQAAWHGFRVGLVDLVTDVDRDHRVVGGGGVVRDELDDGATVGGPEPGDPAHVELLDAEPQVVRVERARLADVRDGQIGLDAGGLHAGRLSPRGGDHEQLAGGFETGGGLVLPEGVSKPSGASTSVRASVPSCHTAAWVSALSPASIWCSAPNDSRSKRPHSAADASRNGAATARTSTSTKPAASSSRLRTSSVPRLNGPGCPGSGGGSCAARRMIDTGTEKNRFASGVE